MKRTYHSRLALIAAASLALALPAQISAQDNAAAEVSDEARLSLAREIVENGFPPETRLDVFGAVMQQVIAQMNVAQPALQSDEDILALVKAYQQRAITEGLAALENHLDAMMEGMAIGYAGNFTLAELEALNGFISSPEGHGFFARSATVNSHPAYVTASQGFLNEYLAGVPAIQSDLQGAIQDLLVSRAAENDAAE